MKLAIFGASGRTGIPLVQQALDEGHEVVAFVRSPEKLSNQLDAAHANHERLHVVQGDAMKKEDVERAIQGDNVANGQPVDAVLSALGHAKGSPPNVQTVATGHVVSAMGQHGVQRLISLSGAGVPAPQDKPKLIDHLFRFLLNNFQKDVIEDAKAHVKLLEAHPNLEWTVVRGPRLTEGPKTGDYRVGWVGVDTGTQAARGNVADFMLKLAKNDRYVHEMPAISD